MKIDETFLHEVKRGLRRKQKELPSKYLYDKKGDQLFQQIMSLPDYYLSRAEMEIFKSSDQHLVPLMNAEDVAVQNIIELGAGDATKTREFLKRLSPRKDLFYTPYDISSHILDELARELQDEIPWLKVEPRVGKYVDIPAEIAEISQKKLILFLGSNLGNLRDGAGEKLLNALADSMQRGDLFLIGLDLIKAPEMVLPAYDDSAGVTAAFTLNLLSRMNRDLNANFQIEQFCHSSVYDKEEGEIRSYLESKKRQEVSFNGEDESFLFEEGELILAEISRKYSDDRLKYLIRGSGLRIIDKFTDSNQYFADYLLRKVD